MQRTFDLFSAYTVHIYIVNARTYKMGALSENSAFLIISDLFRPVWTFVPSLLHFGWELKHKPPVDEMTHLLCIEY